MVFRIIDFREAEEGVNNGDCLCGQTKNFAQVIFSKYRPGMKSMRRIT